MALIEDIQKKTSAQVPCKRKISATQHDRPVVVKLQRLNPQTVDQTVQ